MKAKKIKIRVKTGRFSVPLPAFRFCYPSKTGTRSLKSKEKEVMENFLENMTYQDIDQIIDQLEQEEPFQMVDVEAYDEKDGKVTVKIYTI